MHTPKPIFISGIPEEWDDYAARNQLFLERYPNLKQALDTAFMRRLTASEPIDRFVFGYGRLCCEDFMEILLLAGNGYGIGAIKLLRTLYEHAVTLSYLNKHQDELNIFYDWSYVTEEKATKLLVNTFGKKFFENKNIDPAEIKRRYLNVKDQFMIKDCKKCGTQKLNHSWNKKSLVDMARESGPLKDLLIEAYYLPLAHAHSNLASLATRLTLNDGGGITFDSGPQRKNADVAAGLAHRIILEILQIQHDRFIIPSLSDQLVICFKDFQEIWNDRKG